MERVRGEGERGGEGEREDARTTQKGGGDRVTNCKKRARVGPPSFLPPLNPSSCHHHYHYHYHSHPFLLLQLVVTVSPPPLSSINNHLYSHLLFLLCCKWEVALGSTPNTPAPLTPTRAPMVVTAASMSPPPPPITILSPPPK